MSPRLKLRSVATPLAMAGALWAGSTLTPVLVAAHGPIVNRGGAQTPAPCSPDGVCVPRPETWGVYKTRWRTFPGDVLARPTPEAAGQQPQQPGLGGPQLPPATEEGQLGPAPTRREDDAPAEGAPPEDATDAGLGTLPGEAPLPGFELPGAGIPAPGAGEPAPDAEGVPPADGGAQPAPGADPLDPFGPSSAAPPTPPAWISEAALHRAASEQSAVHSLPVVEHAIAVDHELPAAAPVESPPPAAFLPAAAPPALPAIQGAVAPPIEVLNAPNLRGDDAPPMLPPSIAGAVDKGAPVLPPPVQMAAIVQPASVQPATVQPATSQPASVQPIHDDQVTAASAEQPFGIQLINPAAAIVDPDAQGLQQAIYFEASDQ